MLNASPCSRQLKLRMARTGVSLTLANSMTRRRSSRMTHAPASIDVKFLTTARQAGNLSWALNELAELRERRFSYRQRLWAEFVRPVPVLFGAVVVLETVAIMRRTLEATVELAGGPALCVGDDVVDVALGCSISITVQGGKRHVANDRDDTEKGLGMLLFGIVFTFSATTGTKRLTSP